MIETIGCLVVATAASALITRVFCGPRRRRVKYPCPWDPCGYPLPETPLVSKLECDKYYANYEPEECQGCGKTIVWSRLDEVYVRFKAPAPKV